MSFHCDECGEERDGRYTMKFYGSLVRTTCHACDHPVHSSQAVNMFSDLPLDHVLDESGQPIRVTSRRQLHEAERRYGFKSLVANFDEANFDKSPQAPSNQIADHMKFLYPDTAKSMMADIRRRGITPEEIMNGSRDMEWGR